MPIFFDTHCHLDEKTKDARPRELLKEAIAEGVHYILVPATGGKTNFERILALQKKYKTLTALGLHPLYAGRFSSKTMEALARIVMHNKPAAIGEIGLDKSPHAPDLGKQVALFEAQLILAKQHHLPVILHIRNTTQKILISLQKIGVIGGIVHAFNGSFEEAEQFRKLGFKLGFGSTVTYANSVNIRRLAEHLPDDTLVLETDAPYTRACGQKTPSRPSDLPKYAQVIATLRGESLEKIGQITTQNAWAALQLNQQIPLPNKVRCS